MYLASNGHCANCGVDLDAGWHGDHIRPHSQGGPTDPINGQALCPPCNLMKGDTVTDDLRGWQRAAIERFNSRNDRDFLVCATPGAGKTRLALTLAKRLIDRGDAERVAVIVPTDALRQQWAVEAATFGLDLMPVNAAEDYTKSGYDGCVATYAQLAVGSGADLLRRAVGQRRTVALLDEIHHAGDQRSWGDGIRHALDGAVRRIALTGTPWRQDKTSPIPFVTYDSTGKVVVDSHYEYGAAVADRVCRPIEFHAYDGEATWVDCGKTISAEIGPDLTSDDTSAVLDTILDPDRDWMPGVLAAAVEALRELRRDVPDAAGLVIADKQWQARKYVQQLEKLTGETPTIAVSEDADAQDAIDRFREGRSSWLVAVRMVSEGVDIKRLAVGVYATRTRTPLFFRQVVGRFVRTRPGEEINAKLFIPAVPALTAHAKEIEDELRHQLDLSREEYEKAAQAASDGQQRLELREPLSASEASFQSSIFGGEQASAAEYAAAEEWCRARGIPAMYAPNVVRDVAAQPIAEVTITPPVPAEPRYKRERLLRGQITTLVGKIAHREQCEPQEVNAELLRRGFPKRAKASIADLERIVAFLAEWLGRL